MEKKDASLKKVASYMALKKRFSRNVYVLNDDVEVFGFNPEDPNGEERLMNDKAVKPYSIPVKWQIGELWHYPKKDSNAPDFFIQVLRIEVSKRIEIYRIFEDDSIFDGYYKDEFVKSKKYRHQLLKHYIGLE